jgi:O-antigen ligase
LVLALVLLAWPALARTRSTRLAGSTLLAGILVLLQHRTVWVVLLACFAVLLISAARRGSQRALNAVIAGGLAAGVAAVLVTGGLGQSSIGQSLAETGTRNSTFAWRLTSWQELLHANDSAGAMLFGKPFGSGYLRELNGVMTNLPPHSFYVNSLLRVGAIGLAALIVLFVTGWRERVAAAERLGVQPITVSCMVLAVAVFCITYDPGVVHAAILAGVVAASRSPVRIPASLVTSARPALAPGLRRV